MKYWLGLFLALLCEIAFGQLIPIKGKISGASGKSLTEATVVLVGSSMVALSDEQGHFTFENPEGLKSFQLLISHPGYKMLDTLIGNYSGQLLFFTLQKSADRQLDEVVVSGNRDAMQRGNVAQKVEVISSRMFTIAGAMGMGEGLCFSPGLRVETNCQTCNFTQLRMNGLAGDYSQILINSRPVYNGLVGLYGLDQIPPAIIERVEVIRGGGSVLYGANAIAGTVNIITRRPLQKRTEVELNTRLVGGSAPGYTLGVVSDFLNKNKTAGLSLNVNARHQEAWDANGDGFSEIPIASGLNAGINAFTEWKERHKLDAWAYTMMEERFGGDNLSEAPEQTTQSEFRRQLTFMGGADYVISSKNKVSSWRFYSSGQITRRRHYTGIDGEDGWGSTEAHTLQGGLQWNHRMRHGIWKHAIVSGAELQIDDTFDEVPAYNYLIDQQTQQVGVFVQDDINIGERWKLSAGLRVNKHNFVENLVATPRLNIQYLTASGWNFRAGYAIGFKPPQAFEADMHISFTGGGISRIEIDPDLKQENSGSFTASITRSFKKEDYKWEWSLDGFYTQLQNPFILEQIDDDSLGNMVLLRKNGSTATVYGVSASLRLVNISGWEADAGITLQRSFYAEPVAWSENVEGITNFLRTPDWYGYVMAAAPISKSLSLNSTITLTGPMYVPHFGGAPENPEDILRRSQAFFDWGLRLIYNLKNMPGMRFEGGFRNILNSYQRDFDTTKFRDSNYIYGPSMPRTLQLIARYSF